MPGSSSSTSAGRFATRKSRLDTGLADPNRFLDQPQRDKVVKDLTAAVKTRQPDFSGSVKAYARRRSCQVVVRGALPCHVRGMDW